METPEPESPSGAVRQETSPHNDYGTQVGKWYNGLQLFSRIAKESGSINSDDPDVDTIHITGLVEELLPLQTLFGDSIQTTRREFLLPCNVGDMLLGDIVWDYVQSRALHLIRCLAPWGSGKRCKSTMVFVAYDLGALILKVALSIASRNGEEWVARIARLIFCGSPHRSVTQQSMEWKLTEFLHAKKDGKDWEHYVTLHSIQALAEAILDSTEAFISSKISLQSLIISIYGNGRGNCAIHPAFDPHTATLGIPQEITLEAESKDNNQPFHRLSDNNCFRTKFWAVNEPPTGVKQSLISFAAPHNQYRISATPVSHPILETIEYVQWAKRTGHQLLYINGDDRSIVKHAAEQVLSAWKTSLKAEESRRLLSFTFSSHDPSRATMGSMISSLIVQLNLGEDIDLDDSHQLIDQYHVQNAWTETDLLQLLTSLWPAICGPKTLIFLEDLDECDQDSRRAFSKKFEEIASEREDKVKLLVTSRKPNSLLNELDNWTEVNTTTLARSRNSSPVMNVEGPGEHPDGRHHISRHISEFSNSHYKTRLEKGFDVLSAMDDTRSGAIMEILQCCSGWPQEASAGSFPAFLDLIDHISPTSTPASVLDWILRSNTHQDDLKWTLGWLLSSYRPLTKWELAAILYHQPTRCTQLLSDIPLKALKETLSNLKVLLRGLVTFRHDEVLFRDNVSAIFENETESLGYIWTDIKATAHQIILSFSFRYLKDHNIQTHSSQIYDEYCDKLEASNNKIPASLVSDRKSLVFYIVQSFPHHLHQAAHDSTVIPQLLDRTLDTWSKMWWAMSNPFARTKEAPQTALPVLFGLGLLPYQIADELNEDDVCNVFSAAVRGNQAMIASHLLRKRYFSIHTLADALSSAAKSGNEDMAVAIVQKLLDLRDQGPSDLISSTTTQITWPQTLLWRATWLGMSRLVGILLENGVRPDPDSNPCLFSPSPLYMASRVCHPATMEVLWEHNARTDVLRSGTYTVLHAAAGADQTPTLITKMVERDEFLLETNQPYTPLHAAAIRGSWKTVEYLLELKADPDAGIKPDGKNTGWSPLCSAASWGYVNTVKALLKYGANPNIKGPSDTTAIWYAAIGGLSVECCQALLDSGADPNHEFIKPPLMYALVDYNLCSEDFIRIANTLLGAINIDSVGPDDMTPLMFAASRGKSLLVRWFVENNANINATDLNHRSAIFHAVNGGHVAAVEELLKGSPDLSLLVSGETILKLAMDVDDIKIVEMLLEAGADAELENARGSTFLNLAVVAKKPKVVEILIKLGVDLDHRDAEGWTPLLDSIGYVPCPEIFRLLVDAGASLTATTKDDRGALLLGLSSTPDIMKILLEFRKYINLEQQDQDGNTALTIGSHEYANLECVRLMIKAGVDINAQHPPAWYTPLTLAMYNEAYDLVKLYLAQPDINIHAPCKLYGTALHIACSRLQDELVTELIEKGADINMEVSDVRCTPLISACLPSIGSYEKNGDKIEKIVRKLVENKSGLTATKIRNTTFNSAISAAALGSSVNTIEFLLNNGASIMSENERGQIPIHFAAASGVENLSALLLSYPTNGDIMVADKSGRTCLHWAAQFGRAQAIELVLSRISQSEEKEHINRADVDGWTPLCWALRANTSSFWASDMGSEPRDYVGALKCLIEHGASVSVQCYIGKGDIRETFTPFKLALLHEQPAEITSLVRPSEPESTQALQESDQVLSPYNNSGWFCDICLCTIYGLVYTCSTCNSFDSCKKCYMRIDMNHGPRNADDKEEHAFTIRPDYPEFSPRPEPPPQIDGEQTNVNRDGSTAEGPSLGSEDDAELDLELDDILEDMSDVP